MKNKVLVSLIIPSIDRKYELWLPINITINKAIILIGKSLVNQTNGMYPITGTEQLFNMEDGNPYEGNTLIRNTNIRNGYILVLL